MTANCRSGMPASYSPRRIPAGLAAEVVRRGLTVRATERLVSAALTTVAISEAAPARRRHLALDANSAPPSGLRVTSNPKKRGGA